MEPKSFSITVQPDNIPSKKGTWWFVIHVCAGDGVVTRYGQDYASYNIALSRATHLCLEVAESLAS